MKIRVLFVCIHNSARSQMAEAFLNSIGSQNFVAESAGIEPGVLNPLVIAVMKEEGIDISNNSTKDVFDFVRRGKHFSYVITVCDKEAAERCPIFPGVVTRLHWGFPDPSAFKGTHDERMARTREIRDQIKEKITQFVQAQSAS
jgi:arsenate reductase (thioredoxin)